MKPALAQVCSMPSSLTRLVEDYAAGQCQALEVWLTKLEDYLQHHTLDEIRSVLARQGMAVPVAAFQSGLLLSEGAARDEAWKSFSQRLVICRDLGVTTLVLAADPTGSATTAGVTRIQQSLAQAAEMAAAAHVRLAVEFQAKAPLLNNLQTTAMLIETLNHPSVGICLDVFHFAVGPSKLEDLAYLTCENLFHVQVSDLPGTLRELATDSQRILPGDGDLPLQPFVDRLREIGYGGYVSVELMNHQMWQVGPLAFSEIAMRSVHRLLGQAGMQGSAATPVSNSDKP